MFRPTLLYDSFHTQRLLLPLGSTFSLPPWVKMCLRSSSSVFIFELEAEELKNRNECQILKLVVKFLSTYFVFIMYFSVHFYATELYTIINDKGLLT